MTGVQTCALPISGFTGPIWLPGHGLDGLRARLYALYGAAARVVAPADGAVGAGVTIELPDAPPAMPELEATLAAEAMPGAAPEARR